MTTFSWDAYFKLWRNPHGLCHVVLSTISRRKKCTKKGPSRFSATLNIMHCVDLFYPWSQFLGKKIEFRFWRSACLVLMQYFLVSLSTIKPRTEKSFLMYVFLLCSKLLRDLPSVLFQLNKPWVRTAFLTFAHQLNTAQDWTRKLQPPTGILNFVHVKLKNLKKQKRCMCHGKTRLPRAISTRTSPTSLATPVPGLAFVHILQTFLGSRPQITDKKKEPNMKVERNQHRLHPESFRKERLFWNLVFLVLFRQESKPCLQQK